MPDKKKNDAKKNDEVEGWRPSNAQVGQTAAFAIVTKAAEGIVTKAAEDAYDQVKEYPPIT